MLLKRTSTLYQRIDLLLTDSYRRFVGPNSMWQRVFWILLAVLVAPWSAIIALVIFFLVTVFYIPEIAIYSPVIAFAAVALSYPVVVVAGIPIHLLLARLGQAKIWVYTLTGVSVGVLYGIVMMDFTFSDLEPESYWFVAMHLLVSATVATAFGAISTVPLRAEQKPGFTEK